MENNIIQIPKGFKAELMENGNILLVKIKEELPKTWEECYLKLGAGYYLDDFCRIKSSIPCHPTIFTKDLLPSESLAKAMLALSQLLVCRNVYRNGWVPDYKNRNEPKYCININQNKPILEIWNSGNSILSFQYIEIRDEFFKNFEDLIEEAKELL